MLKDGEGGTKGRGSEYWARCLAFLAARLVPFVFVDGRGVEVEGLNKENMVMTESRTRSSVAKNQELQSKIGRAFCAACLINLHVTMADATREEKLRAARETVSSQCTSL